MHKKKTTGLILLLAGVLMIACGFSWAQTPIPGNSISKYVEALPHFAGTRISGTQLTVSVHEFQQKVLPASFYTNLQFPYNKGTYVWGYKVANKEKSIGPNYPGCSVEQKRGAAAYVTYLNQLPVSPVLQQIVITDQTLHWANPLGLDMNDPARFDPYTGPPPVVTHLHGGEVGSESDGGPDQWFTPNGLKGVGYRSYLPNINNGCIYLYPNLQEPASLWFHDHALGATRLNVVRGLAAAYLLRDWYHPNTNLKGLERPDLPGGPNDNTVTEPNRAVFPIPSYKPEIELAIQDRMFDTNGQLFFPANGDNPDIHPFWLPEFFGDVMVVNGKTWPYLKVEPRRYRFRVLDGCNARFLNMWLQNDTTGAGVVIWQIGSDGGLLDAPVKLDPDANVGLFLGPGERADIIIDFARFKGQTLTLHNDANAPFPNGDPVDPDTTGQIMQFRVGTTLSKYTDPSYNPAGGESPRKSPITPINPNRAIVLRQLTLNEVLVNDAPEEILVNNTKWNGTRMNDMGGMPMPIPGFVPDGLGNYVSELPKVGSTEIWEIINLTMDAHPIHLHLIQFQLLERQDFDMDGYNMLYNMSFPGGMYMPAWGPPKDYFTPNADGAVGGNPAISPFLGLLYPPLPEEVGWKDTVKMYPGQVTRIAVRFARQNGLPFSFDATGEDVCVFDRNNKRSFGPGYVWHCHIVDHEDNEMMRPYKLVK